MPLWFWLALVVVFCCGFCWYISPNRKNKPTKTQRTIAIIWIIFRRIIGFSGAAFVLFCVYVLWLSVESIGHKIIGSLLLICISTFFVYVGVVGQGWNQYGFRDDLNLYSEIKKKYKIRW
jgi:hypothetical protein